MEAFLSWLNNNGDGRLHCPIADDCHSALMSTVTGGSGITITRCGAGDLPGIRNPWGERACPVKTIAAWSIDERGFSWKSENWLAEVQKSAHEESLLICSTSVPTADGKKYLLVCRFPAAQQSRSDSTTDGQYYVISCPSSVLPLRFATAVPTLGQQAWRLEHRHVMPLPD